MYGHSSRLKDALATYDSMLEKRISPDDITFLCLINACSHGHDPDRAQQFFDEMTNYNIKPTEKHYAALVDAFGRSGRLEEAEDIVNRHPHPSLSMWTALLGSCRLYGDIPRGERAANALHKADPTFAVPYVLMYNIYAGAAMWDKAEKVRSQMKELGIKKIPGLSWVYHKGKKYEFYVQDERHPMNKKVCLFS